MEKELRYYVILAVTLVMVFSRVSASGLDTLLMGNEKFVSGEFEENSELFKELVTGQSPHTLIISCSDSRGAPEMIFSSQPGELFVHRNIGNIVAPDDWSLATVLEYGIRYLQVSNVVVVGHESCGAVEALAKGGVSGNSYIPGWLANSNPALNTLSERIPKPDSWVDNDPWITELAKENVRLQLEHLRTNPVVLEGINSGSLNVYGLYYNLSSGRVEEVL